MGTRAPVTIPRQSGRRRQDARQDHDRHGGDQVRHSLEPRARSLCARSAGSTASRSSASMSISAARSPILAPSRPPSCGSSSWRRPLRADGHDIARLDLGGGLGVPYRDRQRAAARSRRLWRDGAARDAWARRAADLRTGTADRRQCRHAGRRVLYVKQGEAKTFRDSGCGHERSLAARALRRPSRDRVRRGTRARPRHARATTSWARSAKPPTSSRATARLPELKSGDLVAFLTAGAYGAVMSSAYNARPPAPEVLVKGGRWSVVRPRIE